MLKGTAIDANFFNKNSKTTFSKSGYFCMFLIENKTSIKNYLILR